MINALYSGISHAKSKPIFMMAVSVMPFVFTTFICLAFTIIVTRCYVCNDKSCVTECDTSSACFQSNSSRIIKNGTKCGCCALCITQLQYNSPCQIESQNGVPTDECGPELKCDHTDKICVYNTEMPCVCEKLNYDQLREDGVIVVGKNRPKCDFLGYYDSVKCIPGSVCFCVNREGERIFGTDYVLNEKSMMCNCSRDAHYLRESLDSSKIFSYGDETYAQNPPFAHCLPNGNYDALQCAGESCYCLTKDLKLQGSVQGITIKETMVCYNPAYHDESYYRVCELARQAMLEHIYNATQHEAKLMGLDLPQCDLDGSFAPLQCRGDTCFCSTRYGKPIGSYQAKRYSEEVKEMNCYCARDSLYITDPTFIEQVHCTSIGSYEPIQCQGSLCYCVDINGIQQGPEVRRKDLYNHPLNCTTANEPPVC